VADQRDDYKRDDEQRDDRDAVLQDREDLLVGAVGGFELPGFAIEHRLDPIDDLLAEEAFGPDKQEEERDHIREPRLDAAAHIGPEIYLGELLASTDDEPADDGAGDRLEATEDKHRQRFQRGEGERVLHAIADA